MDGSDAAAVGGCGAMMGNYLHCEEFICYPFSSVSQKQHLQPNIEVGAIRVRINEWR